MLLFVLIQKVTQKPRSKATSSRPKGVTSRLQLFQGTELASSAEPTIVTVNKTRHNSPSAQTVTLSVITIISLSMY